MFSCCICFHLFCMDSLSSEWRDVFADVSQKQSKRSSVRKEVLLSSSTKSQKRRKMKKAIEEKKPKRPSVSRTIKPSVPRKKESPKPIKIKRGRIKEEEEEPTRPKPKRPSVFRTKRPSVSRTIKLSVPRIKRSPKLSTHKKDKRRRRKRVIKEEEEEEPRSQKQPKRPSLPPVIEYVIILETARSDVEAIEAYQEKVKKNLEQPEEERGEKPYVIYSSGALLRSLGNAMVNNVNVIITSPQILEAMLKTGSVSSRKVKGSWDFYKDVDAKFAILVSKNKIKEFSFEKGSELSVFGLSKNLIKINQDEIKDTFFNKEFNRIDETSLIDVFSTEGFPLKLIYLVGHGAFKLIAQLNPDQYAAFIKAINKKGCLFFVLNSCCAGGKNLAIAHKKIIIRESLDILFKEKIRFPIAVTSLADVGTSIKFKINFRGFFDGLKDLFEKRTMAGVETWIKDPFKSILKNLSGDFLQNVPSIWFPGVDRFFSAIDVDNNITMITDSVLIGHELKEKIRVARQKDAFSGEEMKTVIREPAPDETQLRPPVKVEVERVPTKGEIVGVDIGKIFPIHVINKRAILVYPVVITLPIEVISFRDKPKGIHPIPALVSMVPGPATHYFQTIDMRQFTLQEIVGGLFSLVRVEEPKLFFIKELEYIDKQGKTCKANNFYARILVKRGSILSEDEIFVFGGYLSDDAIPVTFFYSSRKKKFYSSRKEKKEKEKKDGFSKFLDYINPLFCHIIDAAPSKEILLLSLNRVDAEYQVRRMIGKCFSEGKKIEEEEENNIIKKLNVQLNAMPHQVSPYQMPDSMSKGLEQKKICKGKVIGKVLTVLREDKSWPMVSVGVRQSSGAIQNVICSLYDNNIEKGSIVTIDMYDFNGLCFGKIISSRSISLAPEVSTVGTGIVEEIINVEDVKKVLELEKLKGILKKEVEEELLKKRKLFNVKMRQNDHFLGRPDVYVLCDIDPTIDARLIKIGDTVRVKMFPLQKKDRGLITRHLPKRAWRRKKH